MPTLDDLHDAFDHLAAQAPPTLAEPVRRPHRHRTTAVALAAACTAAVAIGVLVALSGRDRGTPAGTHSAAATTRPVAPAYAFDAALPGPAHGESPALAYGFAIPGTIAGYAVIADTITRAYQHAAIYGPTDPPGGQVFVFYGGAFDPDALHDREPVDVDGAAGYYADLALPGDTLPTQVLTWQYADDGWAVVALGVSDDPDASAGKGDDASARDAARQSARAAERSARARRNELALAEALVPAHRPATTPVGLAAGSGLHVDSLTTGRDGGVTLRDASGVRWYLGWSPATLDPADKPGATTTTIDGRSWIIYSQGGGPSALGLIADRWGMTVTPADTASLADMEQFAATLRIASHPVDQHTWFDAADALP